MQRPLYRTVSWVLVVVVLASSFAAILGTAAAASTTYALTGFVDQPGGPSAPPVPPGVTVDLASRATGAIYSTVTGSGGQFTFTSGGTSSALVPGYWGVYVPAVANTSISGCRPYRCAVLPEQQTPTYRFYNTTVLTNSTYAQVLTNVMVLPYNATLNGTVKQNGAPVAGATVELLAPDYNGLVLSSNVTNASGFYNLTVPFGAWILQVTHASGSNLYSNSTPVNITSQTPAHVNPVLAAYAISGRVYSSVTGNYVTTAGNATLYDPVNHYIYSVATPPGGYYAFDSYPLNFTHKSQPFYVIVSPSGFEPGWYNLSVSNPPTAYVRSLTVSPAPASALGTFDTVLNFTGINTTTGKGALSVNTTVRLGNDSVLPALPNASVGQLWAQLGLDFNHSLSLPSADVGTTLKAWIGSQGPFFPAVQALTTINGTGFLGPTGPQALSSFGSTCSATACGLTSAAYLSYGWNDSYALNGTLPSNPSSLVISFRFAHPATSTEVYDYTLHLPTGYALYADTVAPAQTTLLGKGPEGTWSNFTLQSTVSSTAAATATFTVLRQSNFTVNVAVSSTNFTFSKRNILNGTHYNYSVVLGVGENATFSAAPSVYPAGQNGTLFEWNFGDGTKVTVPYNETTNHTYLTTSSPGSPFHGTLRVISSSGFSNNTTFNVSVVASPPTAGIATNATSAQNKTAGTTRFLFLNWGTTLQINATASSVPSPNNLAVALYTLTARGFSVSQNYSASAGADPFSNWTVAFGSNTTNHTLAPGHGVYINLATVKINGVASGVTGWGWIYNLTLQVWSLVGTTSTAHLTILVNDTEPPIPVITLLNSANSPITGGSIVEGPNHIAIVRLNGNSSTDLGNGSIVKYVWYVNNTNTTTFHNITYTNTTVRTGGQFPTVRLPPEVTLYHIRLVVTDKNGNTANATATLNVAENTTLRPVMEAANLTGPQTVNAGSTYTYWVNVTVGGGSKSVATDVTVWFYLLSPSGTGKRSYIGGSPGSVVFYGYSNTSANATLNSTPIGPAGSVPTLKYGLTVRAILSWTPSKSGSFILYAYATATNQFVNNTSVSIASEPVTVHPSPTLQLLEYGGIGAGVVVVILVLVLYFRRRTRGRKPGAAKPGTGRAGLERGGKRDDDE